MEPVTEPHPSSSGSNYAFITHSQDTLPLNLPPSIDNAPLARRRRRRTTPHDQAILEEEYLKCNRPDKARRREITMKVGMGEKEVQIWFCNKRQAQRRRATPLLPHEMIPHSSRMSQIASSSLGAYGRSSSPGSTGLSFASDSVSSAHGSSSPSAASAPAPRLHIDNEYDDDDENCNEVTHLEFESSQQLHPTPEKIQSSQLPALPAQSKQTPLQVSPFVASTKTNASSEESTMTTSAHRRLQDVLSRSEPPVESTPVPVATPSRRTNPTNPLPPPRLLRRSSSVVRLSTSLEGKATVILEDEPIIPSSPPPTLIRTPVRQTQSMQRPSTSRRRTLGPVDSKLWEFCCDNQSAIRSPARTPPQPPEATQALRLIRSKSFSSASKQSTPKPPTTLRRNHTVESSGSLLPPPPPSFSKKLKSIKKERKVITAGGKSSQPKPLKPNSKSKEFSIFEPSLDSDKENRPPGAPVSPPPEPKRRIAGLSGKGAIQSSPIKRRPLSKNKSFNAERESEVDFNGSQESGYFGGSQDSVAAFMAGGESSQESMYIGAEAEKPTNGRSSPRRIDEIECVENLLSLRGGTWR
ncbi:hypothetical protein EDC01DRAFT_87961 [Geopyxis carbonaria]|nr:hypothetical protein EDC01DRAFT_87961 [Geopyxis carbonaria]